MNAYIREMISKYLSWTSLNRSLRQIYYAVCSPRTILEFRSNKKREWSSTLAVTSPGARSSISDSNDYLSACAAALKSGRDFNRFKSEKSYKQILEHTGYSFGREYLRVLKKRGFQIPVDFTLRQSALGDPEVFNFKGLGLVSPSTLRYLKVVSDLDTYFPDWRNQTIIEVGVGYGGQFCACKELGHSQDYFGVDLEIVAKLARKYTDALGFHNGNNFLGLEGHLPRSEGHLFISNYAFSELTPEHQSFYVENYIRTSSGGYVTWNRLSELNFAGMTSEELRATVGGRILPEEPLTHAGNCLIVW